MGHTTSLNQTWAPWFAATRPKTLSAAFVPIIVGTALAYAVTGAVLWTIPIFGLLSSLFIQMGTNLVNDAADFRRGTDNDERLGHKRLIQQGLLTAKQTFAVGVACFAMAGLCGIPLIDQGGVPVLCILAASILSGYLYTAGPYPLAYLGLGEIFVVLFFGIASTSTIYYLQTDVIDIRPIIAGIQLGFHCTVMIAINNLRDHQGDRVTNKKTLAVRWGVTFARSEITLLLLAPFAINFYWLPNYAAALLPFCALPLALWLTVQIWKTPPSIIYNGFLAKSSLLYLLFGCLLAYGFYV